MADEPVGIVRAIFRFFRFWNWRKARGIIDAADRQFTGSVSFMSRSGDWPQVVRCKDGWIGLCVFTAQQWADFAAMIGREDLSGDDRLNSMGGRSRNRELAELSLPLGPMGKNDFSQLARRWAKGRTDGELPGARIVSPVLFDHACQAVRSCARCTSHHWGFQRS